MTCDFTNVDAPTAAGELTRALEGLSYGDATFVLAYTSGTVLRQALEAFAAQGAPEKGPELLNAYLTLLTKVVNMGLESADPVEPTIAFH